LESASLESAPPSSLVVYAKLYLISKPFLSLWARRAGRDSEWLMLRKRFYYFGPVHQKLEDYTREPKRSFASLCQGNGYQDNVAAKCLKPHAYIYSGAMHCKVCSMGFCLYWTHQLLSPY